MHERTTKSREHELPQHGRLVSPSLWSACLLLLLRVRAGGGLISPARLAGFMLVAARLGGGLRSSCSLLLAVHAAAPAVGAVCGVPGSESMLMGLRLGVQSRALGPARGGSSARGTLTSPEGPACSTVTAVQQVLFVSSEGCAQLSSIKAKV